MPTRVNPSRCRSNPEPINAGDEVISTVVAILAELPRDERNHVLQLLSVLLALETWQRACLIKALKPELTDEEVAKACGVSVRTLYRSTPYRAVKASVRYHGFADPPPRGSLDDDGTIEAWLI
jgi:hypothetical protein